MFLPTDSLHIDLHFIWTTELVSFHTLGIPQRRSNVESIFTERGAFLPHITRIPVPAPLYLTKSYLFLFVDSPAETASSSPFSVTTLNHYTGSESIATALTIASQKSSFVGSGGGGKDTCTIVKISISFQNEDLLYFIGTEQPNRVIDIPSSRMNKSL